MRIYIIFFRCDIQKPISYVLDKLVFTYPILDIVHQPVEYERRLRYLHAIKKFLPDVP